MTDTVDIVAAEYVVALGPVGDWLADLRDMVGGRSQVLQSTLRSARQECMNQLRREAVALGADAVIAIDLDYGEIGSQGKSMLLLVVSGTAVKLDAE